jgi:hypothetical protein
MRCQLGRLCFGEQASEYCLCIPYYLASHLIPVERLQIFSQLRFNLGPFLFQWLFLGWPC